MKTRAKRLAAAVLFVLCATTAVSHAADNTQQKIKTAVDAAIRPVMAKYGIPGMAVGITVAGKPYVFTYGVASTATRQPVTRDTLFEIGSVSQDIHCDAGFLCASEGDLSLSDKTSKYLPALQGSQFGNVSLLNLGTHTPGGLPLQVPDNIRNNDELMQYFKDWRPAYTPGTYRTYSNHRHRNARLDNGEEHGAGFCRADGTAPVSWARHEEQLHPRSSSQDGELRAGLYEGRCADPNGQPRFCPLKPTASGRRPRDMIRFVEANMNSVDWTRSSSAQLQKRTLATSRRGR